MCNIKVGTTYHSALDQKIFITSWTLTWLSWDRAKMVLDCSVLSVVLTIVACVAGLHVWLCVVVLYCLGYIYCVVVCRFVVYEKYSASIRQEYSHLDNKEYYQRRKSVTVLCPQSLFNIFMHTGPTKVFRLTKDIFNFRIL